MNNLTEIVLSQAEFSCRPTLFELPRNDAVQNVGARLEAEYVVIQFDVGALGGFSVEGLNFQFHVQPS